MRQEKDPGLSKTRREAGNQAFQVNHNQTYKVKHQTILKPFVPIEIKLKAGELQQAIVNYSRAVVLARLVQALSQSMSIVYCLLKTDLNTF